MLKTFISSPSTSAINSREQLHLRQSIFRAQTKETDQPAFYQRRAPRTHIVGQIENGHHHLKSIC